MDKEFAILKVENWILWQQAQSQAKIRVAGESRPPAIFTALIFGFLYLCSLLVFSAIVPALKNHQLAMFLWSCVVGFFAFLHYREREKKIEEIAEYIFRELIYAEKNRATRFDVGK
jgi:positive regulator of sigma E activity